MSQQQLRIGSDATVTHDADGEAALRAIVADQRKVDGCPDGTNDAIVAMSSSRAHTACPNPFIADWLEGLVRPRGDSRTDPGPYSADTTAGKTSTVYKAHSYPTKVPHETIMRLILHYTEPGDVVLDGFAGTGMAGVAAQSCGHPDRAVKSTIEAELPAVRWGTRRAILNDLAPGATFIAAGLNLPVDAHAFDRASSEMLARFDRDYGWMYTTLVDGTPATIDYTVWSEIYTCPHCGGEVVFYDAAFDQTSMSVRASFDCPSCGSELNKDKLERRKARIRTLAGDLIDRVEYRPVRIQWRQGNRTGQKRVDEGDLAVLRRVCGLVLRGFPTDALPIAEMTHGSRLAPKGFTKVHHLWSDRALAALTVLWNLTGDEADPTLRRALRFWVEQALWGLSWMNRYRPDGFSQVSQFQSGVYYVPALHAECAVRYNMEGTQPKRGKRQRLVRLWESLRTSPDNVRISTGTAATLPIADASVDYVFIDPPFGANIPYADLALVVESWHGVTTHAEDEAIQDDKRGKSLDRYADMMTACFTEFHRVLKPGRWMTVEFSNSSNDVWLGIQQALAAAGFVVADTRVFDKTQHSYRQVTAANAVKRDLIISVYKPAEVTAQTVRTNAGAESAVWAFVQDHLAHLPVTEGERGKARIVRERQADRLYDRMVAYHVAAGIAVPMTTAEFYAGLDQHFVVRDGMYFLPKQGEEYERFRITFKELEASALFITGESSAVQWLRQQLKRRPRTYADIQPEFFAETQKGTVGWDDLPDLRDLLEQNFVTDAQGRYVVPDPKKAEHLEQLRERELLRTFKNYLDGRGPLTRFRGEAVKAGFKAAWAQRDFATIVKVGKRLPADVLAEDTNLLYYVRNAEKLHGA